MPRYSLPQRVNSAPQNDLIEKEAQADSLNNSMPDLLSMGNAAAQDELFGGGSLVIPLLNSNESMSDESKSDESMYMVVGPDQKNNVLSENNQIQNLDDSNMSEISTSKERKQQELAEMEKRMQNPGISLVDKEGHEKKIKSESEVPKVVENAEKKAENPEEGQPGELGQADTDMKKIRELDFEPVRMKENKLNMEVGFRSTLTQL